LKTFSVGDGIVWGNEGEGPVGGLRRGLAQFLIPPDPSAAADYSGLECRWGEIPSRRGETVAVIIQATTESGRTLEAYGPIMDRVLAGGAEQREELEEYLGELRKRGEVVFGIHVARSALMTCLIEYRQSAHFHFVDAAGGGYAAAARAMKETPEGARRAQVPHDRERRASPPDSTVTGFS